MKRFLFGCAIAALLVILLAGCDSPVPTQTQWPVLRIDTVYVNRVDTVITRVPNSDPPRVDTLIVRRVDTLKVVVHDTLIKHDTVVHYDTVRLSRVPAYICLAVDHGDTVYAITPYNGPFCDAAHLAASYPNAKYGVNVETLKMVLPSLTPAPSRAPYLPPLPWRP